VVSVPWTLIRAITTLPFVISTGAYRISYFAAFARTTGAVSRKGNRMKLINATNLDRKSRGAQWRDLCGDALSWKCFSDRVFRLPNLGIENASLDRVRMLHLNKNTIPSR
jgi:hypothetical protein